MKKNILNNIVEDVMLHGDGMERHYAAFFLLNKKNKKKYKAKKNYGNKI